MYSITTQLRGPFATLQLVHGIELRLACVQFDALATSSAEVVSSLLIEANAAAQRSDSSTGPAPWPTAMAGALSDALAARFASGATTPTLLFAALRLSDDGAQVCTAGDLRIQLIVDGELAAATRDHVLQSDPAAFAVPAVAATVPTRWLGGISQGPPESHAWATRAPYAVAVCSSQLHRHRPSPRGHSELRALHELPPDHEGLAVWIERPGPGG